MGDINDDGSIQIVGGKYLTLSTPIMVNSAFSGECFFKCILIAEGVEYQRCHRLKDLFDLLPKPEYKEFLEIDPKNGTTFLEELEKHSDDFVNWRYYMETPGEYRMSPMFTFILMNNLKELAKCIINQLSESEASD